MALNLTNIIKRSLSFILLDVILLSVLVWWVNATPDVSLIEVLIIPALFTINIVSAVIAYLFKKKVLCRFLAVNALASSIIFHFLIQLWFVYLHNTNFKQYDFTLKASVYSLTLDKRDTSYSLYQKGEGLSIEYKRGRFQHSRDSILLLDSLKRLIFVNDMLIGFPAVKDTMHLIKR